MKPQVIIVGTGHQLQAGHSSYTPSQLRAFSDDLELATRKYRVKLIAEEMSSDVLADFGVTATIAKSLAEKMKLAHRYIDLTHKERADLGVDRYQLHKIGKATKLCDAQFAVLEKAVETLRECVWLMRVLEVNMWPVLFICGANHAPRVQYLFNSVGKFAVVEANDYVARS